MSDMTFLGYRRENGRVGVRNHVLIIPVDDICNAPCEAVANNIKGTMALPHAYGRLQFGEDLELQFRTMIGTGSNPNVAAAIVIGTEPGWTKRIVDGIASTGKPVEGFAVQKNGVINVIAQASRVARKYVQWATGQQREECGVADLWVSTKCGESDPTTGLGSCPTVGNMYDKLIPKGLYGCFGETSEITGAEHLCKARGITPEVGQKFHDYWQNYTDNVILRHQTDDLSESQPTKGNIEGGLTTIEEKALGNLEKIGRTTKIIDAIGSAATPGAGPGLYFMDTGSSSSEAVTLMTAGGFVINTFPTGQGNICGNPIAPVIKISANPRTVRTMEEHVDLDVSGILTREQTLDQAGDELIQLIIDTANGRWTCAEALGQREFTLTKLYQSA